MPSSLAFALANSSSLRMPWSRRRASFVSSSARLGGEDCGAVTPADERLAGYLEVVGGAALEAVVRQGDFSLEGGRRATAELIVERPAVTALLVANNLMTLGALDVLREGRVRVPDGVALAAFDDPPWARLIDPPLTTLAQPLRTMADAAVGLLFERIADPRRQPAHPRFDLELRIRRSSGEHTSP